MPFDSEQLQHMTAQDGLRALAAHIDQQFALLNAKVDAIHSENHHQEETHDAPPATYAE